MASEIRGDERLEDDDLDAEEMNENSLLVDVRNWLRTQAPWWAMSCTAHMAALAMLLLLGRMIVPTIDSDAPAFTEAEVAQKDETPLENPIVDPGPPDIEYHQLTTEDLVKVEPPPGNTLEVVADTTPFKPSGDPTVTTLRRCVQRFRELVDLIMWGPAQVQS